MIPLKILALYLVIFLPQTRLLFKVPDQHIGNMTLARLSGNSLSYIFLSSFGTAIPSLSLALQYDFRGDIVKYKLTHIVLTSFIPPLLYLFSFTLTGNEEASFFAALLYALSFNLPVTNNWLLEPEHYEILFFLPGAAALFYGLNNNAPAIVATGGFLLGATQLCKFPALLSIWAVLTAFFFFPLNSAVVVVFLLSYALPSLLFRAFKPGNAMPAPATSPLISFPSLLMSIFKRQVDYIRAFPVWYFKKHVLSAFFYYCGQFMPIIFFALLFFKTGNQFYHCIFGYGLIFLSLIFILRMSLFFSYSHTLLLCIAAGLGMSVYLQDRTSVYTSLLFASLIVTALSVAADKSNYWIFRKDIWKEKRKEIMEISIFLRQNSSPGERVFINMNNVYAYMYTIAERPSPINSLLVMGGFHPKIDKYNIPPVINDDGKRIAQIFGECPPVFIVESVDEWPIVNLSYLEKICGIKFDIIKKFGRFILYRTDNRKRPGEKDECHLPSLFDADEGRVRSLWNVAFFESEREG